MFLHYSSPVNITRRCFAVVIGFFPSYIQFVLAFILNSYVIVKLIWYTRSKFFVIESCLKCCWRSKLSFFIIMLLRAHCCKFNVNWKLIWLNACSNHMIHWTWHESYWCFLVSSRPLNLCLSAILYSSCLCGLEAAYIVYINLSLVLEIYSSFLSFIQ